MFLIRLAAISQVAKICLANCDPKHPLKEAIMSASKVLKFSENIPTMTYEEGLAFIERTRRQLDRFEGALPHQAGETIAPEDAARIRQKLDALELGLREDLGTI
jgi:hypothetical protein